MIPKKNPNQRFCRQISKLFPFSYPLESTLKSVGHVDVDVAVGIDVDVDRHVDAEVDVEFDVGVDVEVCVDVDGDADGDVELGWRRWRWTPFSDAAGTECASKRAPFGCCKPAEDHETREAVCNRLCSRLC